MAAKLKIYNQPKHLPQTKPKPEPEGFAWGNNELDQNAMGGTELMKYALFEKLDPELRDFFQIIPSRVRDMDDRPAILWLHDLWNDPEAQHLKEPSSRDRFKKLVFVSNFQQYGYNLGLGVPYSQSIVMRNAIEPIEDHEKPKDKINLIYHTTPHRGLNILCPVYDKLSEHYGDKVHLDVYSSFKAYGWAQRDEEYKDLFKFCEDHPHITYHGYQPNDVVREALKKAHIFAYPCIWMETSCISVIEAMSAKCAIVCPNYGALPETTGNWANMYQFNEDVNQHANIFIHMLANTIDSYLKPGMEYKWHNMKSWVDTWFNWDIRAAEWNEFLTAVKKNC